MSCWPMQSVKFCESWNTQQSIIFVFRFMHMFLCEMILVVLRSVSQELWMQNGVST